jgi:hypothetical protein
LAEKGAEYRFSFTAWPLIKTPIAQQGFSRHKRQPQ